jgi:amino acid transporter
VSFTAPLSIASGCIGLSSFLAWFWPGSTALPSPRCRRCTIRTLPPPGLPAGHGAALSQPELITRLAWVLFAGVLAAIAGVIVSGFAHAAARAAGTCLSRRAAAVLAPALGGLAQATLLTTYCYWGYYNITFLGGEVRKPERPFRAPFCFRALRRGVLCAMNLAALPSHARRRLRTPPTAHCPRAAWWPISRVGLWQLGRLRLMAALIVWTAFASVFSLLLGYSRVPYAAARDGNYFRFLAAVHPKHGIPHRSLVALGLVAACFCFFSLAQVITCWSSRASCCSSSCSRWA